MMDHMQKLQVFLETGLAGAADAEEELLVLKGLQDSQTRKSVLIAGTQDGDPLSLLSGLGLKDFFPDYSVFSFPVKCVYGKDVCATIHRCDGLRDRFYSSADLTRCLASQECGIESLTVTAPSQLLLDRDLILLTLDESTGAHIEQHAVRCQGVIVPVAADAGSPGDSVAALCQWLNQPGRENVKTAAVLNHAERCLFVNDSMADVMRSLLREDTAVLICDRDDPGECSPAAVLAQLLDAVDAPPASLSEDALGDIQARVEEKLRLRWEALNTQANRLRKEENAWREAVAILKNEARINRYSLSGLVSVEEKNNLHLEIIAFTQHLIGSLPVMSQEVLQNSNNVKADFTNLCCEYIEAAICQFQCALVEDLSNNLLIPRATEVFERTQNQLILLMGELPLEDIPEKDRETMKVEFLKTLHLNIGQLSSKLANNLGSLVGILVRNIVCETNLWFLSGILGSIAEYLTTAAANYLMPNSKFVELYLKSLKEKLPAETLADQMYDALNQSLLPLLEKELEKTYLRMVEDYAQPLLEKAEELEKKAAAVTAQCQQVSGLRRDLAALCGE